MSTMGDQGFDQWLSSQLQQHAAAHSGPSPLATQAHYHAAYLHGGAHVPLIAKIGAAITTKAAIGVAAGALVVGAAGVGESVITGSTNPSAKSSPTNNPPTIPPTTGKNLSDRASPSGRTILPRGNGNAVRNPSATISAIATDY